MTFTWVTCVAPAYLARRGTPVRPDDLAKLDVIGFRNQRTGLLYPWRLRGDGMHGAVRRQPPEPV